MTLLITTDRLDIRPFVPGDLDDLHAMYGDPVVMAGVGAGQPATREQTARALLETIEDHNDERPGLLACVERSTGKLVGRGGFKVWTVDGGNETEIGWMVARDHQSRGLGFEQGLAFRDHAFDVLGRDHVISVIQPANGASIRVAQKVGARYWRDWVTPGGQDVVLYRVDRSAGKAN
jgi:RimJ/RimL family protein N-acetyltransferase